VPNAVKGNAKAVELTAKNSDAAIDRVIFLVIFSVILCFRLKA